VGKGGRRTREKSFTSVSNQTLGSSARSLFTILTPLSQLPFNEKYEKSKQNCKSKTEMAGKPFSKPFS
jgi:hypothetical protein